MWRIRDRATFAALSRARLLRQGPVTMRFVAGSGPTPPRVAIATPRATGTAVARNRVRRRLRAAIAAHERALAPGGAYLFGAGREVVRAPFATLEAAVGELVTTVRKES